MLGAVDPAAAFIAVLGLLVGPIVSWAIATRRLSGKIETSDAKELWAESRSIRETLNARVTTLTAECERLEERIRALEERNAGLIDVIAQQRSEIEELHRKLREAETRFTVKAEEVVELQNKLSQARGRVAHLEAAAEKAGHE